MKNVRKNVGVPIASNLGPGLDPYVAPQVHSSKGWGACLGPACLAGGPQLAKYGGNGLNRNKNVKKTLRKR